MPHNNEAEQAVLGGMIIDKEAIANVMEIVRPDDFYREDNKEIFSAICSSISISEI